MTGELNHFREWPSMHFIARLMTWPYLSKACPVNKNDLPHTEQLPFWTNEFTRFVNEEYVHINMSSFSVWGVWIWFPNWDGVLLGVRSSSSPNRNSWSRSKASRRASIKSAFWVLLDFGGIPRNYLAFLRRSLTLSSRWLSPTFTQTSKVYDGFFSTSRFRFLLSLYNVWLYWGRSAIARSLNISFVYDCIICT